MPPRLQSLAGLRAFTNLNLCSKAAFSNTAKASKGSLSQSEIHNLITIDVSHSPANRRPIPPSPTARWTSNRQSKPTRDNADTNQALINVIGKASQKSNSRRSTYAERLAAGVQNTVDELHNHSLAENLGAQIHRRWKTGDVYAPNDLTGMEMENWKKRGMPQIDVFDYLDMNPVDQYKNFSILCEYTSVMGRIKPITQTGLRRVNQRRIAKAIRRSVGLGIMPSVYRHPEILYNEMLQREGNPWRSAKSALVF